MGNDLSSQLPYLVIVAVVALVAVVSLVLNDGGSVQGAEVASLGADDGCVEGPTIGNLEKQEYVTEQGVKYWDYCSADGKSVHQYRCATIKIKEDVRDSCSGLGFGCERGRCCTDEGCNNI